VHTRTIMQVYGDLCVLLDIDKILLSAHCGTSSTVSILLGHEQASLNETAELQLHLKFHACFPQFQSILRNSALNALDHTMIGEPVASV